MGAREWLNANSAAVTVAAVAIILVALALVIRGNIGRDAEASDIEAARAYFYDSVTKTVFVAPEAVPPIKSPDGNESWRVRMYGCGNCDEAKRFVGMYEKYPPEMREQIESLGPDDPERSESLLVSSDGVRWYPATSAGVNQIMTAIKRRCADALPCMPSPEESELPE